MRVSRRLCAGLGLGLAASACTAQPPNEISSGTPSGRALTIGLTYIPNIQFCPFYVAVEAGFFAQAGLDVALRHHGAQEDLFGALLGGTEDVVVASSDEAMVASSHGSPLLTFATMYQRYPVCLIAPAEAAVSSVTHLAGQRIGLPGRYGSSYYGLLAALSAAGMQESDIQVSEIGYTGVSALLTKKVDAIVGFRNNEPIQFAAQGFKVSVVDVVDPATPSLVGPGLITKKDKLDSATLHRLTGAVLAAERAIIADPMAAIKATTTQVPDLTEPKARANAEQVLASTSELWLTAGKPSMNVDQAAFSRMSSLLHKAGITSTPVDPATVTIG